MSDFVGFKNLGRNVPWMVNGDAYTVSGMAFAGPKAKRRSTYYLANRRSPRDAWPAVATDSRMVLFGVSDFVKYCLTEPITHEDVEASAAFMESAHALGGPLNFDAGLWHRAVDEFGGNLPIRIEALPEGSTFFPNEPAVQVTSLGDGYGEIAAIIEANLLGMVACATARATVTRHLLERMRDEVRVDNPDATPSRVDGAARSLVHDFGMRASSCPQESDIFGRAHLLSFRGTDTFNAAFNAWASCHEEDAFRPTGTSILAQAHRIVNGWDEEGEAMCALADAAFRCGPLPIASFLADTYDFRTCVDKLIIGIALEFKRLGRGVAIIRSDSGDHLENILYIVLRAMEHGLHSRDYLGRPTPTHLRFINGDSVDPVKIRDTFRALRAHGFNATSWGCFGIGGWLRRQGDRDLLSSAYKLSAIGADHEPVVKLSGTHAKMSIPGPVDVVRGPDRSNEYPTVFLCGERRHESGYRAYYDGGLPGDDAVCVPNFDPFADVIESSLRSWDDEAWHHPGRGGLECPVLSPWLTEIQNEVMARHGRRP